MNAGKYIFSQLVSFLPKRVFDGIVKRHKGDKWVKHFTCWNQILVMMFGQLAGCDSLREVAAIIDAIKSKNYHLGFGSGSGKYLLYRVIIFWLSDERKKFRAFVVLVFLKNCQRRK